MAENERFMAVFEKVGHAPVDPEKLKRLQKKPEEIKQIGTAASGNRGHAGRPGERGGSAPGSASFDKNTFKQILSNKFHESSADHTENNKMAKKQEARFSEAVITYGDLADSSNAYNEYTMQDYAAVNGTLRGNYTPMDKEKYDSRIAEIDNVIKYSPPLPKGLEMYRGVGNESGRRLANANVGDICEDKAFQSHSLSLEKANDFAKNWYHETNPMKRTSIDDKQHRTIVRAVTAGKAKGVYSTNNHEMEVTVERGRAWEIKSKDTIEVSDYIYHIITVEEA